MGPEITWRFYPLVVAHPAAKAFIESLAKRQLAAKTIDAYARNLEDLLRTWPDTPPERVTEADAADLEDYLAHLHQRAPARPARPRDTALPPHGRQAMQGTEGAQRVRLADATIQQRLVTARLFYDFCVQRGLRRNPANPVPRGHRRGTAPDGGAARGPVRRRRRLPWIPTDTQWQRLVTDLFQQETLRNQALILLAYDAALRRQEVVGIQLADIDWALGLVQVQAEHAKSGRARRVPISAATERLLRHYVQTVRGHLLAAFGGPVEGPLFLSESQRNPGSPLKPGALNDIVDRLRARLALPELHPHTFRHLRCTVLKRGGVDLDDIALFAGHASVQSTQVYLHLAPTEVGRRVRIATAAFDRYLQRLIAEHVEERAHGHADQRGG